MHTRVVIISNMSLTVWPYQLVLGDVREKTRMTVPLLQTYTMGFVRKLSCLKCHAVPRLFPRGSSHTDSSFMTAFTHASSRWCSRAPSDAILVWFIFWRSLSIYKIFRIFQVCGGPSVNKIAWRNRMASMRVVISAFVVYARDHMLTAALVCRSF